eukprot:10703571-Ditylum_brightwellii.AAC.1
MSHQQLAAIIESLKRKEVKRPMHPAWQRLKPVRRWTHNEQVQGPKQASKGMKDVKEKITQSGLVNGGGYLHCYNQNELNAIIGKSQRKEHNAINKFNSLSLSSSNDNDISHT